MAEFHSLSRRRFVACGLVAATSVLIGGCNANQQEDEQENDTDLAGTTNPLATELLEGTTFAFDTIVTIKAQAERAFIDDLLKLCAKFEQLFSAHKKGTDVWRINHAGGDAVEVDPLTIKLIQDSLVLCEKSGGVFDITIGAVSLLWDFIEAVKPSDEAIQAALPHIDYHQVKVEGNKVALGNPDAAIDLGGVAKGWIADRLRDEFIANNVPRGIINLGGNVLVVGDKAEGTPWRVAVNDPNDPGDNLIAALEVVDMSVVTSGVYERHFELDGINYHHILDPKTGYPVAAEIVSDSIVSKLSAVGDVMATTVLIEGKDKAQERFIFDDDIEGFIVMKDGTEWLSDGMQKYNFTKLVNGVPAETPVGR